MLLGLLERGSTLMGTAAGPGRTRQTLVAVVGPSRATPAEERTAYDVGAALAKAGCGLVTGGLGGVMAAASKGAADSGGLVVGMLPGDDADTANPWVHVALPTGLGEARNVLVVRAAAAVVAVGGSWGTVSEIALACRAGTFVVAVGGWAVVAPDGPAPDPAPVVVQDAVQAVRAVLRRLGVRSG